MSRQNLAVGGHRIFKVWIIVLMHRRYEVHEQLTVLAGSTTDIHTLRAPLPEDERYPTRRIGERCLKGMPATPPDQIGCLGLGLYRDTLPQTLDDQ